MSSPQPPRPPTETELAKQALRREIKTRIWLVLGPIAIWWGLEAIDTLIPGRGLDAYGIHPRDTDALFGILAAPFLHFGFQHVFGNTIGMLLLGSATALRSARDFVVVFICGTLVGGLGTWLIGPANSMHLGASIVIYAYLGYLLTTGLFERSFGSLLFSGVAAILWGGLIFGVLPGQPGVSWQGHLFGCLGGVLAAWGLAKLGREND